MTSQIDDVTVIKSMDYEGRGISHIDNKIIFIDNAITGEKVRFRILKKKKELLFAKSIDIKNPSSQRVKPECGVYGVCGGCSMQHIEISSQLALKQKSYEDTLRHVGKIKPNEILRPIFGPEMHYRHKARLRVKFVKKKNRVLIGFNEKLSHFLTDMTACPVLPTKISELILPLQKLIKGVTIKDKIPQIEYASNKKRHILVLRILENFTDSDIEKLSKFEGLHGIEFWTQAKGIDTVKPLLQKSSEEIFYENPEFGIKYLFNPTGFIQINPYINQVLIRKIYTVTKPNNNDVIFDFFSGVGNFSLPLATSGAKITAIEGDAALVKTGNINAKKNKLDKFLTFKNINLFDIRIEQLKELGKADKWIIDPPREGAFNLINMIDSSVRPKLIIYISCNAATFARDARILVEQKGYRFSTAGVLNMFPHTSHIESMATFKYGD